MLIESVRHEPNCPIPLPFMDGDGRQRWLTYYFIPVDAQNPDSAHVAEVEQTEHVRRLLQLDMYSIYSGAEPIRVVKPVLSDLPPKQNASGKVGNHPTPVPYAVPELSRGRPFVKVNAPVPEPEVIAPSETVKSAEQIRDLSVRDLRASLAAGSIDPTLLAAALTAERQGVDTPPRASWCDIAEQYLNSAKVAA